MRGEIEKGGLGGSSRERTGKGDWGEREGGGREGMGGEGEEEGMVLRAGERRGAEE